MHRNFFVFYATNPSLAVYGVNSSLVVLQELDHRICEPDHVPKFIPTPSSLYIILALLGYASSRSLAPPILPRTV
jgi:hypothetical protein